MSSREVSNLMQSRATRRADILIETAEAWIAAHGYPPNPYFSQAPTEQQRPPMLSPREVEFDQRLSTLLEANDALHGLVEMPASHA